jgi:hypothetical protein
VGGALSALLLSPRVFYLLSSHFSSDLTPPSCTYFFPFFH